MAAFLSKPGSGSMAVIAVPHWMAERQAFYMFIDVRQHFRMARGDQSAVRSLDLHYLQEVVLFAPLVAVSFVGCLISHAR